ncbi:hypothetical protein [Pararhodobacter sp.]|uniref:hypothetical protein n=1 Tax=Pararhodobacter sp. TaxID=2127056 RepID=UPI002AFF8154|nr:hypothetical protein [Pararhodobacter sp.]
MPHLLPQIAHMAAALIEVPAAFAFNRLSQAEFVGGWALGSMGMTPVGGGVWVGHSLFDGAPAHVEIRPAPDLGLIDYAVGTAETRRPRIFIRVTPGPVTGRGDADCVVTLHALRSAQTEDARWTQTCIAHETEILLIKAQLERAYGEARD